MVNEQEEELLEAYLDDALSSDEVERLTRRLADEPALASELAALRQQRSERSAAWQSMEPSEAETAAFAQTVIRGVHRRRMVLRMSWVTRLSGAAAACILLGLGGGWYMWGRHAVPAPSNFLSPVAVNTDGNLPQDHPAGQIEFTGATTGSTPPGKYQVELTDDSGKVLAVQKFNRLDEAQHFAQDLGQVVERQQDVQSGHVTLVSDHF